MIHLPALRPTGTERRTTTVFGGYDRSAAAGEVGVWADQENMSGAAFPALATRGPRRTVRALDRPAGCLAKDALAVVEGPDLVYGEYRVPLELSTDPARCPKQLISMGAYLLIWPDKKYVNTQDLSDRGSLEHSVSASAAVALCRADGSDWGTYTASAAAPEAPEEGTLWLDTGAAAPVLRSWSAQLAVWTEIPETYLKFSAPNIGQGFSLYDGVTVSGLTGTLAEYNGDHVLHAADADYLVIPGILAAPVSAAAVTVARTVPDMDYVTECGNRIWGCKYGLVNGQSVNEIYASALGDFRNWNRFRGLSTDSFAAGRGSDGPFTAAVTHLGHPLFFKEDCIEKVYPAADGAHRIVTVEGRGVQRGCWRSAAVVGETLYYKSRDGVCAYDGSLPVPVGRALGETPYEDARAGSAGELYWLSMRDGSGAWHLFTYDTARRLWHRQDGTRAQMFACVRGSLHWIDETASALICADGDSEEPFAWSVTSGPLGCDLAENRYVSRLVIRCDTAGSVAVALRYDEDGTWQDKGTYSPGGLGSFVVPAPPRRCDHLRVRLSGTAPCRILSLSRLIQRGSDVRPASP